MKFSLRSFLFEELMILGSIFNKDSIKLSSTFIYRINSNKTNFDNYINIPNTLYVVCRYTIPKKTFVLHYKNALANTEHDVIRQNWRKICQRHKN